MTILAAVGEAENSNRILEVADELAQAFDEPLVVVHVIPEEEAEEHLKKLREIPEYRDMGLTEERDRAIEYAATVIENALGDVRDDRVSVVGRVGKPDEEILAAARNADARYIVVGGRKRSPVGKAVFGSTTQSILLSSDRPVMAVLSENR